MMITAVVVGGRVGAGAGVGVEELEEVVVLSEREALRGQAATRMPHENDHSKISIRRVEATTTENGVMTKNWRKLGPVFRHRDSVILPMY